MKTTVCTSTRRLTIQPKVGCLMLTLVDRENATIINTLLTPDEAGALIFGMEQALEVHEVAAQRVAA